MNELECPIHIYILSDQMSYISVESCIAFHKFSIESKIIKIEVPSKKLWSKHKGKEKRGDWINRCSVGVSPFNQYSKCDIMRWTSTESCREFYNLSIESNIIKIGVSSKKLWSKDEEAIRVRDRLKRHI